MINIIPDTVCRDCCFAQWKDSTQIGCERGILDQYRKIGSTVLDCYDETEKEFNVVQGRLCPFFRKQAWRDSIKGDIEERLKLETQMGYLAIVFANKDLEKIMKTVDSLEAQKLKPVEVRIIQEKNNMIPPGQIVRATKNSKLFIRIESQTLLTDRERAIHIAFKLAKYKCQFYSVFNAGYEVPNDFYYTINDYVINGLGQFGVILPESSDWRFDSSNRLPYPNGFVVAESVHMYWYFKGNCKKTVLEQVEEWEHQNKKKICYTIQELRKKNQDRKKNQQ